MEKGTTNEDKPGATMVTKTNATKLFPILTVSTKTCPVTGEQCISADVVWHGADLDRPHTDGWSLAINKMSLAMRLKKAVDVGAVFQNPKIVTDINGKTYVSAEGHLMGRYLNAELKRLGF
jgi:hypothetical protein